MTQPVRYFLEIVGDGFTCTSTLEKNEEGLYEFEWESGFQSGTSEYETVEGNVIEITKAEYDMIQMTVEDEELLDYQLAVKEYVMAKYREKNVAKNESEKEFLQFISETEGLSYYQAAVERLLQVSNDETIQNAWETMEQFIKERTK